MVSTTRKDASRIRCWMLLAASSYVVVLGVLTRMWEMSPVNPAGEGIGTTFYGVPVALAGIIAFGVLAERLPQRAVVLAALVPVFAVWFVICPGRLAYQSLQCVVGNNFDACKPSKDFLDVAFGATTYRATRDLLVSASHENEEFVLHACRTHDREEAWWRTTTEFCAVALRRGYAKADEICPVISEEHQGPVGWWCDVGSNGKLVARSQPLTVWF